MLEFMHQKLDQINNNVILTILSDLNVPTICLIISFLSKKKLWVRYNGSISDEQDISGGGPQCELFTILLFNLQVNIKGALYLFLPVLSIGVLRF